MDKSLQERFAYASQCFGCGPDNAGGLHIRSFPLIESGDELIAHFRAAPHHLAFPGVLCGGIVGTLLDCHGNWAAVWHLMRRDALTAPPSTVTAEFTVKLKRPTPLDRELVLRSRAVSSTGPRVVVSAELVADDQITATLDGIFVAVKEGHPAFHRW